MEEVLNIAKWEMVGKISLLCKHKCEDINIAIFKIVQDNLSLSLSLSIFFKSVDISTIDISYRYIEQGYQVLILLRSCWTLPAGLSIGESGWDSPREKLALLWTALSQRSATLKISTSRWRACTRWRRNWRIGWIVNKRWSSRLQLFQGLDLGHPIT